MAYCSLQQKKIRELIQDKALTEQMVVLDEQKVKVAQAELKADLKKYYEDANWSNPLGQIKGNTLSRNVTLTNYERQIYASAMERYEGIQYGEVTKITDANGKELQFTVDAKAVGLFRHYDPEIIHINGRFTGTKNTSLLVADAMDLHEGLENMVRDVRQGNFKYLAATNQAIVDDILAIDAKVGDNSKRYKKLGDTVGLKLALDSLVDELGSPELIKVNDALNEVLDNQNWEIEIDKPARHSQIRGAATESRMSVNVTNIAMELDNQKQIDQMVAQTFVHEKVHLATIRLMDNKEFKEKITEMYKKALKDRRVINQYGASDIFEFVAEGLSEPTFQKILKDIPYEEGTKSLFQHLIDTIRDGIARLLGKDVIKKNMLEELLEYNINALTNVDSSYRINRINTKEDWNIFTRISNKGRYNGDASHADLFDWAEKYGLIYKPQTKTFGVHTKFGFTQLNKSAIDRQINAGYSEYFTGTFMRGQDMIDKINEGYAETYELNSIFSGTDEILGDINRLKEFVDNSVILPADQPNGLYQVVAKEYYRTTAYLGFKADDTNQLLKNASRIGNVMDELGKRVFRGDDLNDITYSSVNEFVKDERWKRELKLDNKLDKEKWEKKYRNPVAEESFDAMKQELSEKREFLMDNYDIKGFHVDIIGWDDERYVAGEIDVLAEHNDGSFRVIDIKTRRQGLDGYDGAEVRHFNTMNKHTKQTNVYSMFLHNMGFNMRPPMVIMGKPEYDSKDDVDNAPFLEIKDGELLSIIDLPLYDLDNLDEHLFNYTVQGVHQQGLFREVEGARVDYKDWIKRQRNTREKAHKSKFATSKEHKKALKEKLTKLSSNVKRYTNLLKNEVSDKTTFSSVLRRFDQKLEKELGKEIDDVVLAEQIVLAEEFLEFAAQRFDELINTINSTSESSIEEMRDAYSRIKRYQEIKVISKELFESIGTIYHNAEDEEIYIQLKDKYKEFENLNKELEIGMRGKLRSLFINTMTDQYLGSKAEIDDNNAMRRKYEAVHKDVKSAKKRNKLVEADMAKEKSTEGYKQSLSEKYRAEIKDLLDSDHLDMSSAAFMINADPSINNKFTMLMHAMLTDAEHEYTTIANEELLALQKLHKSTSLSRKDLKGIVEKAADGQWYLKGEYKIEFFDEVQKWRKQLADANAILQDAQTKKEKFQARKKVREINKKRQLWIKANTVPTEGYSIVPKDKWKTNLKALSDDQRRALKFFTEVSYKSAERTQGRQSLVRPSYIGDAAFVMLPGSLKTTLGFALEGDLDGARKKAFRSITQIEKDDTEEGAQYIDDDGNDIQIMNTGLDGEVIYTVPIFYRNNIKDKEQNLDLFTVYALEIENTIRYKVFDEVTKKSSIFMDAIKGSEFYKTSGVNGLKVGSKINGKVNVFDTITGIESVTVKQVQKMLENRAYGMTRQYAGKIFGNRVDVHRAMDAVGTYSAYASMSFKVLSATNNFITGKVANFVEGAGGEFYDRSDLRKAEAMYWGNMPQIMGDFGRPIKESLINQLSAKYDAADGNLVATNQYERTNMLSRLAKPGTSFALYSMGEHEINNTVMLATLSGRKIIDKDGNYLDKQGKITSDKAKAASLMDVYELDDLGVIQRKEWANYSDYMPGVHLDKGGEVEVRELVKDRIYRTQGAYDQKMQGQVNRLWWGRLFSQFRKHMPPQMLNRFRGIGKALKDTGEIPDSAKYFNLQAKTEEYGYHTSFIRFLSNVIKQAKFDILAYKETGSNEWKQMTNHERSNVIKSVTEINYITTVAILAAMAANAATDDRDDELMWTLAYLLRRQRADSGLQYVSMEENWRLLESPMAAIRVLQNAGGALKQITNPGELYKGGKNHGKSKLLVKMRRAALMDRLDQFEEGYSKSMYNLFNR